MIETERLILKPYESADASALVINANRPEVARMMESIRLPFTEADALERIAARQCTDTRFTFALHEKSSGDAIGEIGAGGATNPRLGYFLRPESWGKGYASEAIRAALDHAFRTLGWPVIDADCFDDNPASIRTLEKAGFVRVGVAECQSQAREEDSPTSMFRIARAHWATPVLKTARLTLRPYRGSDVERILELLNDIEVSRMLSPVAFPYTRALADEWLSGAKWSANDAQFALDDGTGLIGGCGLNATDGEAPMLGFWLGRRYWGAGLMSEAVEALLDWAFTAGGSARLVSNAFVDNIGSQRVHEKAGFLPGETVEHFSAARGEPIDAISYTLERTDWQARQ